MKTCLCFKPVEIKKNLECLAVYFQLSATVIDRLIIIFFQFESPGKSKNTEYIEVGNKTLPHEKRLSIKESLRVNAQRLQSIKSLWVSSSCTSLSLNEESQCFSQFQVILGQSETVEFLIEIFGYFL